MGRTAETKYVDGYLDSTTAHKLSNNDDTWADCELNPRQQTAVYGCLPVPQQGTGYADRDGRRIFMKTIRVAGHVVFNQVDTGTAALHGGYVRIVIVKDTRTNGTALSAENVLGPGIGSDGNASLSADAAGMLMTKPDGWGRYKILYSKVIKRPPTSAFNDGTDGAWNGQRVPFKFSIKCNCTMNFNASTGLVGSIVDNSFHLLACHSQASGSADITYVARASFTG